MLGRKAVSEPEMGVNEPPARRRSLELHAQPPDINVDRAVSLPQLSAPRESTQVLARHDSIRVPGELREQPQFSRREQECPAAYSRQMIGGQDLERADSYDVGVRLRVPKR